MLLGDDVCEKIGMRTDHDKSAFAVEASGNPGDAGNPWAVCCCKEPLGMSSGWELLRRVVPMSL